MHDFTHISHGLLLEYFIDLGYSFLTFNEHLISNEEVPSKQIILRHDVEQRYKSALIFAKIQHNLGIKGTYFFRILPNSFKPDIVKQISDLGHEVGYHYDDLTEIKGDYEKAIVRFKNNLNILRDIAPVKTICMDGSPLSSYDNKDLWNQYDYKDFGIIGEPYYDMDFDDFFYLTDTGRRWDGWKTSVRDKVPQQEKWNQEGLVFHSTNDIINAANQGKLPDKIMMTFHPQRWHNSSIPWFKELVLQNAKNVVKRFIVKE
ncbi:MAG: hypothetical protein P8I80_02910 [Bacteroidales bacterium]|jgi:hypothetical protein|nr:hypothetical protein [Bacteroidales bacterium]